jgi:hypothetical protein
MADADTGSKPVDQDTLVSDIDATRAQLARTIDAISDRVSPRRNAERAVDELRERVSRIEPVVIGVAVAATVVGVGVLVLWRRRKR